MLDPGRAKEEKQANGGVFQRMMNFGFNNNN